jgi:hypothetical protein
MRSWSISIFALVLLVGCQNKLSDSGQAGASTTGDVKSQGTSGGTGETPKDPVTGMIKGQPFTPDNIVLEGTRLAFKKGKEFFADQEITIELPYKEGDQLQGKEWKLGGNPGDPAVTVSTKAGDNAPDTKFVFGPEYTATVRFTKQTSTTVEGTIDLQVKNPGNTFLRGTFTAAVKKSPFAPLGPEDAPYVHGKIVLKGNMKQEKLVAGFVGMGTDGKPHSNSAGYPVTVGVRGFVTSSTFAPQLTSLTSSEQDGVAYRHVTMPPGDYLVYVQRNEIMFTYKRVKVKEGDQLTVDLTVDPSTAGDLVVTLPATQAKASAESFVSLIPFGGDLPNLGPGSEHYFRVATVKPGETKVTVSGVPAGSYWAVFGTLRNEVQVVAGKSAQVTLSADKK